MRRIIPAILAVLVLVVALGAVAFARGDASSVTRARVERSVAVVFAHRYVERSRLLGRPTLTPQSLHAKAMCDKHGPDVPDVGPGGDWICLLGWTDPEAPMPAEGYGKFELNVHSNDCFTAVGPTKLTGFLTITDTTGKEVINPVFEFDGCFDPHGDDEPTGVEFPSLLVITSTTVAPDAEGNAGLQVTCGTGNHGCAGSISATAGGQTLGSTAFTLQEESTSTLKIPGPLPADATEVTIQVRVRDAVGPSGPVTLPVQRP